MINFEDRLQELNRALNNCEVYSNKKICLNDSIDSAIKIIKGVKDTKRNLFIIGNGGSSGIASHAANDFINMCQIRSITFHDISVLTCLTNDYGYENAFSRLIENFSEDGDCLIAISSSGNSPNIINAVNQFKKKHNKNNIITLSGFDKKNKLINLGVINFWIDSKSYGIVEISHQFLLHFLADSIYFQQKNES